MAIKHLNKHQVVVANAQELKDKAKRVNISKTELKGIYDKI